MENHGRESKWVEKASDRKLKVLRSDNGSEYTSTRYLKSKGVTHELTVPKTPQQNGTAERLNRTLVEMTRSMLVGGQRLVSVHLDVFVMPT